MNTLTKADWDSKMPIYEISHERLFRQGLKCLLLDVDGTLLSKKSIDIPVKVKEWIYKAKTNFSLYLISNNPSKKRIQRISSELGINYEYKAFKPSRKITLNVIRKLNEDNNKIAIIGDRILTDVIVGNRCNIKTILVRRLNKKGVQVKFNFTLFIEKFISFFIF